MDTRVRSATGEQMQMRPNRKGSPLWFLPALMAVLLPVIPSSSSASGMPNRDGAGNIQTSTLDRSISETLNQPEYNWRLPRDIVRRSDGPVLAFLSILREKIIAAFKWIGRLLSKVVDWLLERMNLNERDETAGISNRQGSIQMLLFALLAITASILGVFLFRIWKRRKKQVPVVALASTFARDLADDNVSADQLPSDEWMKMAAELMDKGELRLAIRAMFLSCLAGLAHSEKIIIAKHKSNHEYMIELERRAHNQSSLLAAFSGNIGIVERVWYGMHPASPDLVEVFIRNMDAIAGDENHKATAASGSAGQT